ncbi:hypothetical protein QBC41DRAFT_33907 [Cercophora samala]|uniref:Secreted protein n=1 Tax=Cercophora samala TaxID=330535 RepID=A0AA39YZZ5_9PEZI|nr:hypothetical protein QBC41DRAFT_33907 [Cercophora samala]
MVVTKKGLAWISVFRVMAWMTRLPAGCSLGIPATTTVRNQDYGGSTENRMKAKEACRLCWRGRSHGVEIALSPGRQGERKKRHRNHHTSPTPAALATGSPGSNCCRR